MCDFGRTVLFDFTGAEDEKIRGAARRAALFLRVGDRGDRGETVYQIVGIALFLWNAITFLLYGWDKLSAVRGWRRISERTLLEWSSLGAVGALMGMIVFRHKVRKKKFLLLIPLFLLLEIAVAGAFVVWRI